MIGDLFIMEDEREQALERRNKYLIEGKGYVKCAACGDLIKQGTYGYDIEMCGNCQEYQMRER